MFIFVFMILIILGFKFFPKITGSFLIIYVLIMFVADIFNLPWAWWPFGN